MIHPAIRVLLGKRLSTHFAIGRLEVRAERLNDAEYPAVLFYRRKYNSLTADVIGLRRQLVETITVSL